MNNNDDEPIYAVSVVHARDYNIIDSCSSSDNTTTVSGISHHSLGQPLVLLDWHPPMPADFNGTDKEDVYHNGNNEVQGAMGSQPDLVA